MNSHIRWHSKERKLTNFLPKLLSGFLFVSIMSTPVFAQDMGVDEPPDFVVDPYNRGTPQRSFEGFVTAVDGADYETAAEYLDLRNLRGRATSLSGPQLARRLDVILKRTKWIDVDNLTDVPAGRSGDGLPEYRDSIGVVKDGSEQIQLLMQRVPRGDGASIWKVSNATVSVIPNLYDTFGYPDVIEDLRRALPVASFLGIELFQWVAASAVGALAYIAILFVVLVVKRFLGESSKRLHGRIQRFFLVPFGIWSVVISMNATIVSLGIGATADSIDRVSPVSTLITLWLLFAAIDVFRDSYSERLQATGKLGARVLLRPLSNAAKLLVFLVAVLVYLDRIGINVTTVLAGLGVGGIAVALALQKPLEDVLGAITLYTQQPVRVGDFCRIGTTTGIIEEIGLRTTYIRTVDNTRIAMPNAQLANSPMENISAREKVLYRPSLRLRYNTPPEQIRSLLDGLRELLEKHAKVKEGFRVRFNEIGNDALMIELFAYIDVKTWPDYLAVAEELNLSVLDVVASSGASLHEPFDQYRTQAEVPLATLG
jgi:MscS family membrane protein